MQNQTATWTKLKTGDWGIRVKGDKPARGDVVTVTKKSGDTSPAVVDAVLWTGEDRDDGEPITLCAVVTVRGPRRAAPQPAASTGGACSELATHARPEGRAWVGVSEDFTTDTEEN